MSPSRSALLLGGLSGLGALGFPLLVLTGPVWLELAYDAQRYRGTSLASSIGTAIFVCAAIGFVVGTMLKPRRALLLGAQLVLFTLFAFLGGYLQGAISWAVDPGCRMAASIPKPYVNTFPFWEESILHFLPRPQAQAIGLIVFIPVPLMAITSFFAMRAIPLQPRRRRNLGPAVAAIWVALVAFFLSAMFGPSYLC